MNPKIGVDLAVKNVLIAGLRISSKSRLSEVENQARAAGHAFALNLGPETRARLVFFYQENSVGIFFHNSIVDLILVGPLIEDQDSNGVESWINETVERELVGLSTGWVTITAEKEMKSKETQIYIAFNR